MSEDNENPAEDDAQDAEDGQSAADDWAAALEEQRHEEQKDGADPQADVDAAMAAAGEPASGVRQPEWLGGGIDPGAAQPMQPEEFSEAMPSGVDSVNLDMVLDVPVTISMEIGRTKIPIRNLLQLNQGSVVELDRLAGEPLNVLVNNTLIAHGEVVVVNEKFGIRLTDVISPSERIRKINK
ncbi:flagellar motor switch protein FliN [Thiorhodovibrio frisius]|uniref:Flagellar motor switch protein FliN n=1 Tax=Thiorhodovibrio frisius TaxID=631362 RepID=H8YZL8_9GAMM|nr:flagellar motor switch protein FliN [Thiorhodovibrio frisius]EIC22145.1 flagellar motor switch protein FliN [Thiorhodovibrio frisius]WPL24439.1 Flagellar motor switch protein FliN [Thiorhodovibrio frisius]